MIEVITEEDIKEVSKTYDGTCPFLDNGECADLSVEECNKCLQIVQQSIKARGANK